MSLKDLYRYFAIPKDSRDYSEGYELINHSNKYIIFLQHHFMLMVFLYNESEMIAKFTNTLENIEELCITYIKKYKNVRNFPINKSITKELNYINKNNSGKFKNLIAVIGFLEFYKTEEVNILLKFKSSIKKFKSFIRTQTNELNNSLKEINNIRKEKNIDPFPDTIYSNIDFTKPCKYSNTIMQANNFLMYNYDDLDSYINDERIEYFEELNKKFDTNNILTIYKNIIDDLNISDLHELFLIPKTIELNANNKYIISLQHYFISIVFLYDTIDIKAIFTNTLRKIQVLCISLLKKINPAIPNDTYTNSINIYIYDKLDYIIRTEDDAYLNDDIKFTNLIAVFGFIEYYKSK
jgi:hypothetical protein